MMSYSTCLCKRRWQGAVRPFGYGRENVVRFDKTLIFKFKVLTANCCCIIETLPCRIEIRLTSGATWRGVFQWCENARLFTFDTATVTVLHTEINGPGTVRKSTRETKTQFKFGSQEMRRNKLETCVVNCVGVNVKREWKKNKFWTVGHPRVDWVSGFSQGAKGSGRRSGTESELGTGATPGWLRRPTQKKVGRSRKSVSFNNIYSKNKKEKKWNVNWENSSGIGHTWSCFPTTAPCWHFERFSLTTNSIPIVYFHQVAQSRAWKKAAATAPLILDSLYFHLAQLYS